MGKYSICSKAEGARHNVVTQWTRRYFCCKCLNNDGEFELQTVVQSSCEQGMPPWKEGIGKLLLAAAVCKGWPGARTGTAKETGTAQGLRQESWDARLGWNSKASYLKCCKRSCTNREHPTIKLESQTHACGAKEKAWPKMREQEDLAI